MNLHTCTFIDITWPNRQGPMKLIFQGSGFLRWEHFMKKVSTYMRKMYNYTDIYTLRLTFWHKNYYCSHVETIYYAWFRILQTLMLNISCPASCKFLLQVNVRISSSSLVKYISTSQLVNPFLSISVILRIDACIDGRMDFLGSSLLSSMRKSFFVDTVTLPVVVNTAFEARETSKAAWSTLVQGREATPRWRHRHMPGGGREVLGIACMAFNSWVLSCTCSGIQLAVQQTCVLWGFFVP